MLFPRQMSPHVKEKFEKNKTLWEKSNVAWALSLMVDGAVMFKEY
jgi:hypothetical protein